LTDPVDRFIKDFEDVSMFPNVYKQLKRGGFTKGELEKISYKNLERIILNRFPSK
jgi:microsomal dipeptidase-like Zn-dependent dipeptidase